MTLGGEVQAASADDAAAEAAEEAVAAADDAAAEGAEEAVAATDDAVAEGAEEAVAATDDATPGDDAVAAVDDAAAAPIGDAAVAAVDDAAPAAPADDAAAVVAAGDAGAVAMAGDAVVAGDVVMVAAPKPPNPAEAKRLNEVGFAARKAGDHAGAMAAYKAAVAADADNVWAHYNYACELALAGNSKDALAELVLVYKLDTGESRKALAAARKDSDFASLRDLGQFQRLTR
ncbi:MAG: hypothetical protein U1F43_09595 [Myxococcota bacterium]